jgi:hypothetical protein
MTLPLFPLAPSGARAASPTRPAGGTHTGTGRHGRTTRTRPWGQQQVDVRPIMPPSRQPHPQEEGMSKGGSAGRIGGSRSGGTPPRSAGTGGRVGQAWVLLSGGSAAARKEAIPEPISSLRAARISASMTQGRLARWTMGGSKKIPRHDGHVDIPRLRAEVDWEDPTEMERAVLFHEPKDVQSLIKELHADPELAKLSWNEGETLLHMAASENELQLVRTLLGYGASVRGQ